MVFRIILPFETEIEEIPERRKHSVIMAIVSSKITVASHLFLVLSLVFIVSTAERKLMSKFFVRLYKLNVICKHRTLCIYEKT